LNIDKLPYLNEILSAFDEIWYATADLELDDNHVAKFNSRIQNGGRPPY